jgi:hypothetical protein
MAVHSEVAIDAPIRNMRRVRLFSGYCWFFAAGMFGCGVLVAVRFTHEGAGAALGGIAFGVAFAMPAVWYGKRLRRAKLRINPPSVVVQNPIHRYVLSIDDVEEFQPGNVTPGGNNGTPGIVVRLKSGREIPVWALAEESSIFSVKRKTASFAPLAEDLNSLLAAARSGSKPETA